MSRSNSMMSFSCLFVSSRVLGGGEEIPSCTGPTLVGLAPLGSPFPPPPHAVRATRSRSRQDTAAPRLLANARLSVLGIGDTDLPCIRPWHRPRRLRRAPGPGWGGLIPPPRFVRSVARRSRETLVTSGVSYVGGKLRGE